MKDEIKHPTIGTIHGLEKDGVLQFLGIKYASLADRFAEPELVTEYDQQPLDATTVGAQALSSPTACEMEYGLFQKSLPHEEFAISDRECLHMNIACPKTCTNLPVLIFLHGGGFMVGSAAWPQYNQSQLVKLALDIGRPFVGVTVNYRVGAPGFLTSSELLEAGYKANNGLRDQSVALKWVQRFISGFGGNPGKVTLAGQSAGAIATMLQLESNPQLLSQILVMSGSTLLTRPVPLSVAETAYESVVRALGLENLSVEARIEALVHGDGAALYEKTPPGLPMLPVVDGDAVTRQLNYSDLSGNGIDAVFPQIQEFPRMMIGDCQFDGNIFGLAVGHRRNIATELHRSLSESLCSSPDAVDILERIYDIRPDMPDEVAFKKIFHWASDIGFLAPAMILARSWPGRKSFLYHFQEPNPWDGPWKGEATHALDAAFLFQNFNQYLPQEQQGRARDFAKAVIDFIAGQDPFPPCENQSKRAKVFGPLSTGEGSNSTEIDRESHLELLTQVASLDDLHRSMQAFMSGH